MKFRKSFKFFRKILFAVCLPFLFNFFAIVAFHPCFPTCYRLFVTMHVVVSPGFIPPNLYDVYPHYTDFDKPISFFGKDYFIKYYFLYQLRVYIYKWKVTIPTT